jgi:hypothetical protein
VIGIPLRRGARHDRSSRCGAGCGGRYDAGPEPHGLRMERPGAVEIKAINAGATGGRSKCMSGRQSARTRHVSAKATIPGDMQQAAKSIRVRNAGVEPLPRLVTCRVPKAHGSHVLAHGAAGAVKRPVVPHAPSGRLRKAFEFRDRRALKPDNTRGDDARPDSCSPDAAKRNPGFLPRAQLPDFAALHPGYEECAVPGVARLVAPKRNARRRKPRAV